MGGVGEEQLEALFEQVPERLPIGARGFHRHGRDTDSGEPVGQPEQVARERAEGADLLLRLTPRPAGDDADGDQALADVDPGAASMDDLHAFRTSSFLAVGWRPSLQQLPRVLSRSGGNRR